MYFIVVGCGSLGATLAGMLSMEGHDIVVIDRNQEAFAQLGVGFNGVTVNGTGIDEDILRRAGIERADGLAAATSNDATNIMVAQMARELFHVPRVVSRVYDPDKESVYKEFGLDTVSPKAIGVAQIRGMLLSNGLGPIYPLGEVSVLQIPVKSALAGYTVREAFQSYKTRGVAIARDGRIALIDDDAVLSRGDILWVAVLPDAMGPLKRILAEQATEANS